MDKIQKNKPILIKYLTEPAHRILVTAGTNHVNLLEKTNLQPPPSQA